MYKIAKEFHFSAAHQLAGLAEDHPCSRLHGHNYIVTLILKANKLDEKGFVFDFRQLDFFKKFINNEIDHQNLNDVFDSDNVTSEFLAKYFYDWCKPKLGILLYSVRVSETSKSWAEYEA